MSGDDEIEPPPQRTVVRVAFPRWAIVLVAIGWMLAIRLEMTRDYVGRGKLELMGLAAATMFALVNALRFVVIPRAEDETPPTRNALSGRFIVVFMMSWVFSLPPLYGLLGLVNSVGVMDDVVRVRCRATRLEMRVRPSGGGRRPIVHYTCLMPDGRSLAGRAPEVLLPAEVGKTLVIPSARGRLGVWLRVGAPEPFPEAN
jgi:hypothetical protein